MPIYEYRCEKGHTFEAMQRMTDDPVTTCEVCGAPVQRVFHPVAVHFKGSGFYTTDYAKKSGASRSSSSSDDSSSSSSSSSKESSDSKESSGTKKESDSKTGSASSGSGDGGSD